MLSVEICNFPPAPTAACLAHSKSILLVNQCTFSPHCQCRGLCSPAAPATSIMHPNSSSSNRIFLSRAVAITDAPLHHGEAVASLVLPPHTQGCFNSHPIRGLQLPSSSYVVPPGRCGAPENCESVSLLV